MPIRMLKVFLNTFSVRGAEGFGAFQFRENVWGQGRVHNIMEDGERGNIRFQALKMQLTDGIHCLKM